MNLLKRLFGTGKPALNKRVVSSSYSENVQKVKKHTCPDLATACDDCKRRFGDFLYEDECWRRIDKVGEFSDK